MSECLHSIVRESKIVLGKCLITHMDGVFSKVCAESRLYAMDT